MIKLVEKLGPYLLGLVFPVLMLIWGKRPSDLANYKELMGATISVGSIGVAFLAAAITLIPTISGLTVVKQFKQIGAYEKLIDFLIAGVVWLFACSFLSVLGLFLNPSDNTLADTIFLYTWLTVFGISMAVAARVIIAFIVFLKISQK